MEWIHGILTPYLEEILVGVTPIDSYNIHKMGSIVQTNKNLGAKVYLCGSTCRHWHWKAFEGLYPRTLAQIC